MPDEEFFRLIEYVLKHRIPQSQGAEDVRLVWYCKTIQNRKAIAITVPINRRFYEITYNGDTSDMYVDIYEKAAKQTFSVPELRKVLRIAPQEEKTVDTDTGADTADRRYSTLTEIKRTMEELKEIVNQHCAKGSKKE